MICKDEQIAFYSSMTWHAQLHFKLVVSVVIAYARFVGNF